MDAQILALDFSDLETSSIASLRRTTSEFVRPFILSCLSTLISKCSIFWCTKFRYFRSLFLRRARVISLNSFFWLNESTMMKAPIPTSEYHPRSKTVAQRGERENLFKGNLWISWLAMNEHGRIKLLWRRFFFAFLIFSG